MTLKDLRNTLAANNIAFTKDMKRPDLEALCPEPWTDFPMYDFAIVDEFFIPDLPEETATYFDFSVYGDLNEQVWGHKLSIARENALEVFLDLLAATSWRASKMNKKSVLFMYFGQGKKAPAAIMYSSRGFQVMSKFEFPQSEEHPKWTHPYALKVKTPEEAIHCLMEIQKFGEQK